MNGRPLDMVEPRVLQYKLQEPILLLGKVSLFSVIHDVLTYNYTYLKQFFFRTVLMKLI